MAKAWNGFISEILWCSVSKVLKYTQSIPQLKAATGFPRGL